MSEKYIRNFKQFQKDRWYIYTGNQRKTKHNFWNDYMDFVFDHRPLKCCEAIGEKAAFMINGKKDAMWNWFDVFDDWIEIKDPSKEYRLLEGEKCYNSDFNTIETVMFNGLNCSGDLYYALIDSKTIKDDEQEELSGFKYEEMSFENYVYFGNDIMFIKKNKFVRL